MCLLNLELGRLFLVNSLTAQLIDTKTGNHLWAENYDRNIEDIFDLQDEISLKILRALHIKLVAGAGMNPCARATDNVRAYLKLIQAMYYGWQGDIEGNKLSMQKCEEAIKLDPNYGPAYSYLAWGHLNEIKLCISSSPKQSVAKAFELAQKALKANNVCPFAHETMGGVYMYMGKSEKALEQFDAAIEMDPNWPDVYAILAMYFRFRGQPKEALASIEKAFRLNPLPPPWYFTILGSTSIMVGRYDEAISALESGLRKAPNDLLIHTLLAIAYAILGREEHARSEVSEALRIHPHFSFACIGHIVKSYKDEAVIKRITDGLHKAGLK